MAITQIKISKQIQLISKSLILASRKAYDFEVCTSRSKSLPPLESVWVVLDGTRRIAKLLNLVHHHIETISERKTIFALMSSSVGKLQRGAANRLTGRASGLSPVAAAILRKLSSAPPDSKTMRIAAITFSLERALPRLVLSRSTLSLK